MNRSISRILSITALAVFVAAGVMQGAQQPSFHLPFTAHWGKAVMTPGDYKVTLPAPSLGASTFQIFGSGNAFFALPQTSGEGELSRHGSLRLVEIDGQYFVRELSVGTTGKIFTFPVPKAKHRQEMAKSGNPTAVSVAVN